MLNGEGTEDSLLAQRQSRSHCIDLAGIIDSLVQRIGLHDVVNSEPGGEIDSSMGLFKGGRFLSAGYAIYIETRSMILIDQDRPPS